MPEIPSSAGQTTKGGGGGAVPQKLPPPSPGGAGGNGGKPKRRGAEEEGRGGVRDPQEPAAALAGDCRGDQEPRVPVGVHGGLSADDGHVGGAGSRARGTDDPPTGSG